MPGSSPCQGPPDPGTALLLEGGAGGRVPRGPDVEEVGVLWGGLGLGCPSEAGLLPQGGQGAEAGELEGPGVAGS